MNLTGLLSGYPLGSQGDEGGDGGGQGADDTGGGGLTTTQTGGSGMQDTPAGGPTDLLFDLQAGCVTDQSGSDINYDSNGNFTNAIT